MIHPRQIVDDNWVKIDFKDIQDSNIGSGEEGLPFDCPFFVYGAGGKQYPRITIKVQSYLSIDDGRKDPFTVRCNMKEDVDSWWDEAPIPVALIEDVIELIKQYKDGQADVATAPDSRSDERKP